MGSFIFLIFIGIFIYRIVKAAEKSNPKNQGRPNQQRVQQSQSQTYQTRQRQPQQKQQKRSGTSSRFHIHPQSYQRVHLKSPCTVSRKPPGGCRGGP